TDWNTVPRPGASPSHKKGSTGQRRASRPDVVAARRGVVVRDDRQGVAGERPQVVDAAAAARRAVGVVAGHQPSATPSAGGARVLRASPPWQQGGGSDGASGGSTHTPGTRSPSGPRTYCLPAASRETGRVTPSANRRWPRTGSGTGRRSLSKGPLDNTLS